MVQVNSKSEVVVREDQEGDGVNFPSRSAELIASSHEEAVLENRAGALNALATLREGQTVDGLTIIRKKSQESGLSGGETLGFEITNELGGQTQSWRVGADGRVEEGDAAALDEILTEEGYSPTPRNEIDALQQFDERMERERE